MNSPHHPECLRNSVLTFQGPEFEAAGSWFQVVNEGQVAHEMLRIVEADVKAPVALEA